MFNQLLGQPTLLKSFLCSFVVHVGTFSLSYFWWTEPIREFSFAGERDAIRIEASYAENQIIEPIQLYTEIEQFPVNDRETQSLAERTSDSELAPCELPATKKVTVVKIQRLSDAGAAFEVRRDVMKLTSTSTLARKSSEEARPQVKPVETKPRITRRVVEATNQTSSVALNQVFGFEDKTPPVFSGGRKPEYPVEAIRRKLKGAVLLRLEISRTGVVERVEVSKSSGHAILDRAATEAVMTWRGSPALRNGEPVATVELLHVNFRL